MERKHFAVIGDPIAHSLSPAMHNAAFAAAGKDAEYTAIRVVPEDMEAFFGVKVYLNLWVKVKENWRDSDFLVRNFGYSE